MKFKIPSNRIFFFGVATVFLSIFVANIVYAQTPTPTPDNSDEIEDLENDIEKYQAKLDSLANRGASLANEIEYFDTQINLTLLRIQSSQKSITEKIKQIDRLKNNIDDLAGRITKLEESIDYQDSLLKNRLREKYKVREDSIFMGIFGAASINDIVKKAEYLTVAGLNDQKLLDEMSKTKQEYANQKNIYEETKKSEEALKAQLEQEKANQEYQKRSLEEQRVEKKRLLDVTKNDEAKYQALLEEAQAELNSFKGFTSNAGGGTIGSNGFGSGDDGNYFSQRDSRWANNKIGRSGDTVYAVGCLVTSVAMVHKYYGSNTTPAKIASNASNFFSSTAAMLIPWPGVDGRKYTNVGKGGIDSELAKGNPVIVGVYANNSVGTHFVVIYEKKNGKYMIHDPWYGPDQVFTDRYSMSSIFQAVAFK